MLPINELTQKQQALQLLNDTLLHDNFFNISHDVFKNGEPFILADSATFNILVGVKTSIAAGNRSVSDDDKLTILAQAFHTNRVAYAAVVVWQLNEAQPIEIEWHKLN
jgi:hypothetical protein